METNGNKLTSKIGWSYEQQQVLSKIVEEVGEGKWKQISQKLNQKFPNRYRTNKQCRERYINFEQMKGNLGKAKEWSHENLQKLIHLSYHHHTKWSIIRKQMNEWSQNFLKNKFNGFLHKVLRKIENICRQRHRNNYKTIKFNTLVRLFLFPNQQGHYKKEAVEIAEDIRTKIFEQAIQIEKGEGDPEILASIEKGIHQFATISRAYLMNMGKKRSTPKFQCSPEVSDDDSGFHNVILLKMPGSNLSEKNSRSNVPSGQKGNNQFDLTLSSHGKKQKTDRDPNLMKVPCIVPLKN